MRVIKSFSVIVAFGFTIGVFVINLSPQAKAADSIDGLLSKSIQLNETLTLQKIALVKAQRTMNSDQYESFKNTQNGDILKTENKLQASLEKIEKIADKQDKELSQLTRASESPPLTRNRGGEDSQYPTDKIKSDLASKQKQMTEQNGRITEVIQRLAQGEGAPTQTGIDPALSSNNPGNLDVYQLGRKILSARLQKRTHPDRKNETVLDPLNKQQTGLTENFNTALNDLKFQSNGSAQGSPATDSGGATAIAVSGGVPPGQGPSGQVPAPPAPAPVSKKQTEQLQSDMAEEEKKQTKEVDEDFAQIEEKRTQLGKADIEEEAATKSYTEQYENLKKETDGLETKMQAAQKKFNKTPGRQTQASSDARRELEDATKNYNQKKAENDPKLKSLQDAITKTKEKSGKTASESEKLFKDMQSKHKKLAGQNLEDANLTELKKTLQDSIKFDVAESSLEHLIAQENDNILKLDLLGTKINILKEKYHYTDDQLSALQQLTEKNLNQTPIGHYILDQIKKGVIASCSDPAIQDACTTGPVSKINRLLDDVFKNPISEAFKAPQPTKPASPPAAPTSPGEEKRDAGAAPAEPPPQDTTHETK